MATLTEIMIPHSVEIPAHLVEQAEVPVVAGKLQRQGDVTVIPQRPGKVAGLAPIPPEGIPVVRGEAGGNTHLLVGEGRFAPTMTDPLVLGILDVAEGETAYLLHPEHGATGIGCGQYRIGRQRQKSDEIRVVAD